MQVERRRDLTRRDRFDALHADLLHRLRQTCEAMPERELEQLTARMIRIRLKYESTVGMPVNTNASGI